MVETKETWVRDDSLMDVVKGMLTPVGPDASNRLCIFLIAGKSSKGQDPKFEVVNIFAVKLGKSNEFSNIMHNLWLWPSMKQWLML